VSKFNVEIDYTNWRGERAIRKVQPIEIKFTCCYSASA
jgi:hypothetical protein